MLVLWGSILLVIPMVSSLLSETAFGAAANVIIVSSLLLLTSVSLRFLLEVRLRQENRQFSSVLVNAAEKTGFFLSRLYSRITISGKGLRK